MPDIYRDTEQRYHSDPHFKAAVDYLYCLAVSQGFTPGELKQAAFLAALHAEQYAAKLRGPFVVPPTI